MKNFAMARAYVLVALVALLSTGVESRACVLPAYAAGPPGSPASAEKCKTSEDCCGDLQCNEDQACVPAGKMNAREQAFVAHLVIEDCVNHAVAMSLDLESASQAIANASAHVKNAAGKAKDSINKAVDAASEKAKDIAHKIKDQKDQKSEQLKEKSQDAKNSAQLRTQQAKDAANKAAADAKNAADHAKERASKSVEELNRKRDAVINNATQHFVNLKAKQSKDAASTDATGAGAGGAGGYDKFYKGYMAGAGGSPDGSSDKSSSTSTSSSSGSGAAASGGSGGAGASMDWQKFVPGGKDDSASKKKRKHGKSDDSSSAGTAGASAGGGFDYQKFMPGASSKTVNMKAASGPSGSSYGPPKGAANSGTQGGFDYSKFTGQKLANMAAAGFPGVSGGASLSGGGSVPGATGGGSIGGGGSVGGFDWSKFVPHTHANATHHVPGQTTNVSAHGTNMSVYAGSDDSTTSSSSSSSTMQSSDDNSEGNSTKPGAEGAPCGTTPYKDFGACNRGLKCETHPLFTSFAPGKCVKKPARRMLRDGPSADDKTPMKFPVTTPGGFGGPCGVWKLGNMDFGGCKDDLSCVEQNQITFTFYDTTYGLPNICKNSSDASSSDLSKGFAKDFTKSFSMAAVENDVDTDDDAGPDYFDYGADMDIDSATKAAHDVVGKANEASLKAADEAELLAHKLLAAVAQVRAAAAELAKEAANPHGNASDGTPDSTTSSGMIDETDKPSGVSMLEIPLEAARSNFFAFSIGGLVFGVAALIYKQTAEARSYQRI